VAFASARLSRRALRTRLQCRRVHRTRRLVSDRKVYSSMRHNSNSPVREYRAFSWWIVRGRCYENVGSIKRHCVGANTLALRGAVAGDVQVARSIEILFEVVVFFLGLWFSQWPAPRAVAAGERWRQVRFRLRVVGARRLPISFGSTGARLPQIRNDARDDVRNPLTAGSRNAKVTRGVTVTVSVSDLIRRFSTARSPSAPA